MLGIDPLKDSWLAWQINRAVCRWGEHIDFLEEQNSWRDKDGRPIYRHDIPALLGLAAPDAMSGTGASLAGQRFTRAEVMKLDIAPKAEPGEIEPDPPAKSLTLDDFIGADGAVAVEETAIAPGERYRPITDLLQYRQPGRGETRILTEAEARQAEPPVATTRPRRRREPLRTQPEESAKDETSK